MSTKKLEIIKLFKKDPSQTYTTTQIVEILHKEELDKFRSPLFLNYMGDDYKKFKKIKLKLHRQVLYHLNQLVEKGLLKIVATEYNGEKVFGVPEDLHYIFKTLPENKIVHLDLIALDVPKFVFSTPADNYFNEKVVLRGYDLTWARKINSVLVDGSYFSDLKEVDRFVDKAVFLINDSLAIINLEHLLEKNKEEAEIFINEVIGVSKNYNKTINIIFDIAQFKNPTKLIELIEFYKERSDDRYLKFIFQVSLQDMQYYKDLILKIIDLYWEKRFRLNLLNKTIFKGIIFEGDLGPYHINEEELESLKIKDKRKNPLFVVNNVSLTLDFKKFLQKYNNSEAEFYKLVRACVKSLFIARRFQRSTKNELLYELYSLTKTPHHQTFKVSKEYLRLWNYEWESLQNKNWLKIWEEINLLLLEMGKTQEAIYKSAGLPLTFKINFSSAFNKLFESEVSKRSYGKHVIYNINDLKSKEIKEYLNLREKLVRLFDNNDRIRFFRSGRFDPNQTFEELMYLLHYFYLPYISYDFETPKEKIKKLTEFFK